MFYFIILLYGLSVIEANNVKITGEINFGEQLAKVLRGVYYNSGIKEEGVMKRATEILRSMKHRNQPLYKIHAERGLVPSHVKRHRHRIIKQYDEYGSF